MELPFLSADNQLISSDSDTGSERVSGAFDVRSERVYRLHFKGENADAKTYS